MSARPLAVAVLALGLAAAAAQPPADRAKLAEDKLAEMQGVYELKAMEVGGAAARPEFLKGRRFVVRRAEGGFVLAALTWLRVDGKDRVVEDPLRVRVDPTATPAAIDFEEVGEDGKVRPTFGIYRFADETLTVCASDTDNAGDRPTAFKTSTAKPREYLMVLKRVQKGK